MVPDPKVIRCWIGGVPDFARGDVINCDASVPRHDRFLGLVRVQVAIPRPRPSWLFRRVASPKWDGLLWGCGVVCALATILASFVPNVSEFSVLFSVTLFVNGPYGALLPAAQEPVVMVFGRLYPPTLVAAVATLSATSVEYVNYRLFDAVMHSKLLSSAAESRQMRRVVRWFGVQPFLTVVFCALTPIPFVLARVVGVAAKYPVARFLSANALGRFPRFWAYGALGVILPVSTRDLLLGGAALTVVGGSYAWMRRRLTGAQSAG